MVGLGTQDSDLDTGINKLTLRAEANYTFTVQEVCLLFLEAQDFPSLMSWYSKDLIDIVTFAVVSLKNLLVLDTAFTIICRSYDLYFHITSSYSSFI